MKDHFVNVLNKLDFMSGQIEESEKKLRKLENLEDELKTNTETIINQSKIISELREKIKKLTSVVERGNKRTYSSVVCGSSPTVNSTANRPPKRVRPEINAPKEPILVIKPNADVTGEEVQKLVKDVVNPIDDPVTTMRQTAKGNLIVHCTDHSVIETV